MKNTLTIIISAVLIICVILLSNYYNTKEKYNKTQELNQRYEKYLNKDIKGTNLASIINQAVDDNESQMIKKDENGRYIYDNEKSVNIEIKITEFKDEKIFTMETLYNGGMGEFVKYYGQINFKCNKIEYNSKGQVKYMLFEQIKSK